MAEPSPTAQTLHVNFLQITQFEPNSMAQKFPSELESEELGPLADLTASS